MMKKETNTKKTLYSVYTKLFKKTADIIRSDLI